MARLSLPKALDLRVYLNRQPREIIARRHERFPCRVRAEIVIVQRNVHIPGLLLDISAGGALVRPPNPLLVDRRSERVDLVVHEFSVPSHIIATSPRGYHLRFLRIIDAEEVEMMRMPARLKVQPQRPGPAPTDEDLLRDDVIEDIAATIDLQALGEPEAATDEEGRVP